MKTEPGKFSLAGTNLAVVSFDNELSKKPECNMLVVSPLWLTKKQSLLGAKKCVLVSTTLSRCISDTARLVRTKMREQHESALEIGPT